MKNSNLSTKDLSYLADIFNWNINAFNLCNHFSNLVEDENAIQLINSLEKKHKQLAQKTLKLIK